MSELTAYRTFEEKQRALIERFSGLKTPEERYHRIIELGEMLDPFPEEMKCSDKLVKGCQSRMYLLTEKTSEGILLFRADSDALISKGLAALLLLVYNEETPEVVIKAQPTFLDQLGIPNSLSPGRANGLYSLRLRMQQEALRLLNA